VRPGDEEARGARLLFRDHADAAALRVVDHVAAVVPVDERRRLRRVLHHARQVDVAAALDVQLCVRHDLRLRNCNTITTNLLPVKIKKYSILFIVAPKRGRREIHTHTNIKGFFHLGHTLDM